MQQKQLKQPPYITFIFTSTFASAHLPRLLWRTQRRLFLFGLGLPSCPDLALAGCMCVFWSAPCRAGASSHPRLSVGWCSPPPLRPAPLWCVPLVSAWMSGPALVCSVWPAVSAWCLFPPLCVALPLVVPVPVLLLLYLFFAPSGATTMGVVPTLSSVGPGVVSGPTYLPDDPFFCRPFVMITGVF